MMMMMMTDWRRIVAGRDFRIFIFDLSSRLFIRRLIAVQRSCASSAASSSSSSISRQLQLSILLTERVHLLSKVSRFMKQAPSVSWSQVNPMAESEERIKQILMEHGVLTEEPLAVTQEDLVGWLINL